MVLHINLALQGRKCFSNCFGFRLLIVGPPACVPRANERPRRESLLGDELGLSCKYCQWETGGVEVCGSAAVLFIRFHTSRRFVEGISCTICIIGFICHRSGWVSMEPVLNRNRFKVFQSERFVVTC